MEEVDAQLDVLGKSERRVAMATVVATRGTTPKKEGVKMWVREGGRTVGSIGGRIDAKVIAESERVLATGEPRLVKIAIGDEDAWEMGLACGGTVQILVEALELSPRPAALVDTYRRIAADLERGRAVCLVRSLRDPVRALVVKQDRTTEGSLGDAERDRAAVRLTVQLFPAGLPVTQELTGEGTEAFFEVHAPRPHLVAVGAGHMSMPLVSLARALGFRTTVVDPRPRFATRERFPEADELRVGIASEIVAALPLVSSTAVVLTIHDQEVEVPVLRAVLGSEAGYVGVLGSRKRGRGVLEVLRGQGVPPEQLARVQVPVGLDIGAHTAAEIALSVLAQIVAMRSGRPGTALVERAP